MRCKTEAEQKKYLKSVVKKKMNCWIFTLCKQPTGYGRLRYNGQEWRAHRLSYALFIGKIPHGKHVLHKCDNPSCINPKHLKIGTHKDNMQDCVRKNRHRGPYGDGLKSWQIIAIQKSKLPSKVLSKKFSVSISHVYKIKRSKGDKNVTD